MSNRIPYFTSIDWVDPFKLNFSLMMWACLWSFTQHDQFPGWHPLNPYKRVLDKSTQVSYIRCGGANPDVMPLHEIPGGFLWVKNGSWFRLNMCFAHKNLSRHAVVWNWEKKEEEKSLSLPSLWKKLKWAETIFNQEWVPLFFHLRNLDILVILTFLGIIPQVPRHIGLRSWLIPRDHLLL